MLTTKGKSGIILKIEIIRNILLIAVVIFALPWGIMALVRGLVVINVCHYILFVYQVRKVLAYPVIEQLKDIFPYLFISLCCFLPTLFFQQITTNLYLQLFLQIAIGTGLYFIVCKYSGSKIIEDAQSLLIKQIKKSI